MYETQLPYFEQWALQPHGSVSSSFSKGQPQSRQAVNHGDYRNPLVRGYTIKSGNGLINATTPHQQRSNAMY